MDQVEEYHQTCAKNNFTPIPLQSLPFELTVKIVNQLILRHSNDTALILSTLPFPMNSDQEHQAQVYVQHLNNLTQNLPPTLLVSNGEDVPFISTSL
jgi:phospholipid N-methyltransferase